MQCDAFSLQYAVLPSLNGHPPSYTAHFEAAVTPQTPSQVRYVIACLFSVEDLAQFGGQIAFNNQLARTASKPLAYNQLKACSITL